MSVLPHSHPTLECPFYLEAAEERQRVAALRKTEEQYAERIIQQEEEIRGLRRRVEELEQGQTLLAAIAAKNKELAEQEHARVEKAEAAMRGAVCPGCDGSGTISREQPGDAECPYSCKGDSFAQVLARAEKAEAELEAWKSSNLYPQTYREAVERAAQAERERDSLQNVVDYITMRFYQIFGRPAGEAPEMMDSVQALQADLDAALDMMLCQSGEPGDGCSSHPRVLALLEKRRVERG